MAHQLRVLGDVCRYATKQMLNLAPIFSDAIRVCGEFGDALRIAPLPTAVYMMQRDVITSYRYALTHYFPISLHEHYLQDSSIGPPYAKWAKFTNEDFDVFGFACLTLMRFTSRIVHETVYPGLKAEGRLRDYKSYGDRYTGPICSSKHNSRSVGIRVHDDNRLEITEFSQELSGKFVAVGDRTVLHSLRDRGLAEADLLEAKNEEFGVFCRGFQQRRPIVEPFDQRHESWWA